MTLPPAAPDNSGGAAAPADGIPPSFPNSLAWLANGLGRQPAATTVALIFGWSGAIFALWSAAAGLLFGVLIALGLMATNHFTRSLFHAGAGQAVTVVAVLAGALAGAGGAFLSFLGGLFLQPSNLIVAVLSGAVIAAIILAAQIVAEQTFLRWQGYRQLTTDEARRVVPLAEQAAEQLGLDPDKLPRFAMSPKLIADAMTRTRTIILTESLLALLNDAELRAVLQHELHHWSVGDAVGLSVVSAAAWPIVFFYYVGTKISGRDFSVQTSTQGGSVSVPGRGFWTVLAWLLLWPSWLLIVGVIAPVTAATQRRHEYEADDAARDAGNGPALAAALSKIITFETGRVGWEQAVTRHHPPKALRIERLMPSKPGDDRFAQKELGGFPVGITAGVAMLALVAVLILGGFINAGRANVKQHLAGTSHGTAKTTTPPVNLLSGQPYTAQGAIDAVERLADGLNAARLDDAALRQIIHLAAVPSAETSLDQYIDAHILLHAANVPADTPPKVEPTLCAYRYATSRYADVSVWLYLTSNAFNGVAWATQTYSVAWTGSEWRLASLTEQNGPTLQDLSNQGQSGAPSGYTKTAATCY